MPADGDPHLVAKKTKVSPAASNAGADRDRVPLKKKPDIDPELGYPPIDALPKLSEAHVKFLTDRGINVDGLDDCYVFPARAYFAELGREGPAIAFPYIKNDRIYSVKLRSIEGKYFSSRGSRHSCYLDWKLSGDVPSVVIVEGELDAIALAGAGVPNVLSVPNGVALGADEAGFMGDLAERLRGVRRIIIAGDMDGPGLRLRAELARRFGKARCYVVDWPDGCKDANDTIVAHGAAKAIELIGQAAPMPVDGLVEASAFTQRIKELYDGAVAHGLEVGLGHDVNSLFKLPFGFLTVLTGWPNDGKSQLLDNILVHMAERHGLKTAIWSPENGPEIHIAKLIEIKAGFPFFNNGGARLTAEEVQNQLEWVNDSFYFLTDTDEVEASIESILDRIEVAVQRYGVRVAVIDPYNHIAKPNGAENEVEWIRKLLIRIKRFAQSHELHIFLVAHPRQLPSGSRRFPPTGFHIAGGAPWNAITDFGLTVFRPRVESDEHETGIAPDNSVDFITWKVRHKWHGRRGVAKLEFDPTCGRYYEQPIDIPARRTWRPTQGTRHWQDNDDL